MFVFSLLAFAALLTILGIAATRGLLRVDEILEIRDDADSDPLPSHRVRSEAG